MISPIMMGRTINIPQPSLTPVQLQGLGTLVEVGVVGVSGYRLAA
jgi:hypothetical protein